MNGYLHLNRRSRLQVGDSKAQCAVTAWRAGKPTLPDLTPQSNPAATGHGRKPVKTAEAFGNAPDPALKRGEDNEIYLNQKCHIGSHSLILSMPGRRIRRERGFSLLEIMVVVGLLTVIVLGLFTIFDQTQRALRGNTTQVDVLEAGRAATALMVRQIEQCAPASLTPNLSNGVNLYLSLDYPNNTFPNPIYQGLGTNVHGFPRRTNVLQSLFLVMQQGNQWSATGFFVGPDPNTNAPFRDGVGTLYQFIPTNAPLPRLDQTNLNNWVYAFERAKAIRTNAFPIVDGVIHLKFSAYDAAGWLLHYDYLVRDPSYSARSFSFSESKNTAVLNPTNNLALWQTRMGQTEWYFLSNALPSYIEMELGILEPPVWAQAKARPSTPGTNPRRTYLEEKAGQVHLFRKRIPIRSSHS